MSIKSDKWIKRMALERRMIEPFSESQVRDGVISYGLSSYGYDIRVAGEFKIFTNINTTIVDPKRFDQQSFVDFKGEVCIIPPQLLRFGPDGGVLPDPPEHPHDLRRKIDVRALRHHCECHAVRAGVGGNGYAGDQQHHSDPGQDLCERRHRPGHLLRVRRDLRNLLRR